MTKVNVVVKQPQEETAIEVSPGPVRESAHKLVLAGIGAMAMTQEALADLFARLVEMGEQVDQESRKLLRERMQTHRRQVRKVRKRRTEAAATVEAELETQVEAALGRLNVPTRGDRGARRASHRAGGEAGHVEEPAGQPTRWHVQTIKPR
jgi:poly(hydroxyalkanoate) granule-associated protein